MPNSRKRFKSANHFNVIQSVVAWMVCQMKEKGNKGKGRTFANRFVSICVAVFMAAGAFALMPSASSLPIPLASRSHVVIAVIDTGLNPYQTEFRAPDYSAQPSTYITGYPANAQPVSLTFTGDYATVIANDAGQWSKIQKTDYLQTGAGQGNLYYFPGTKIIGAISFDHNGDQNYKTIDGSKGNADAHGTAVCSCVAGNTMGSFPEGLIVIIEADSVSAIDAGYMWAANQPWIDIITTSTSVGLTGTGWNPGVFNGLNAAGQQALQNGKLFFAAAGNGIANSGLVPTSTFLLGTSSPSVIAVGSNEEMTGTDALYHDFPVQITAVGTSRNMAGIDSFSGTSNMMGTSFASPAAAGVAGRALYKLRQMYGDVNEGASGQYKTMLRNAALKILPAMGPFANGVLTCQELREAVLKTAVGASLGTIPWYAIPLMVPDTQASFVKEGYGHVTWGWETSGPNSYAEATTYQSIINVVSGASTMPQRITEEMYLEQIVEPAQSMAWGWQPAELNDGDAYPENAYPVALF
jgi:hypothetical protein